MLQGTFFYTLEIQNMFSRGITLRVRILTFGIAITILSLAVHLSVKAQLVLLLITLLLTGIPHGSFDFYLEEQRYQEHKRKFNRFLFLAKYILLMIFYAALWFFFPNLSLFIFICLTAYHFGEIDWISKNDKLLNPFILFLYGLIIILFLITVHIKDSAPLVYILLKERVAVEQIITMGATVAFYCKIGFCLVAVIIFIVRKRIGWNLIDVFVFLTQTLLLYLICTLLPFYLSFMFYFGIWHSSLSLDIIRKQLNFTNNMQGWKKMLKKCSPFVMIAVLALFVFSFSKYSILFSGTVITNIIIGIAILTLPHLQVFSNAIRSVSILKKDYFNKESDTIIDTFK